MACVCLCVCVVSSIWYLIITPLLRRVYDTRTQSIYFRLENNIKSQTALKQENAFDI